MNLYSLNLKPFRNAFYTTVTINVVITLATFIAGSNVLSIVLLRENSWPQTRIFLLLLIVGAFFQTSYQKKLLKKLEEFSDFEEKATHYLKIYKVRLSWKLISCIASCFLHILTGRNLFLYFALFDVLTTFLLFPNKTLIRREIKLNDLEFVDN